METSRAPVNCLVGRTFRQYSKDCNDVESQFSRGAFAASASVIDMTRTFTGALLVALSSILSFGMTLSPSAANQNCFKEGSNNWQLCAATCIKACQDIKLDFNIVRKFC